mgnify:CR=1 FL=1
MVFTTWIDIPEEGELEVVCSGLIVETLCSLDMDQQMFKVGFEFKSAEQSTKIRYGQSPAGRSSKKMGGGAFKS